MIRTIKLSILATLSAILLLPASTHAAGSASLSLSPNSGSYVLNSTFAVNIYENSNADPINVVEADLSFNQALLQLTSISCNTAVFGISAPGGGTGVTCATYTPTTGNQLVAVANFRVVGNGSASVNFAGTSHIYRSTDNIDIWNQTTTGGTFAISAPASTPTPVPTTSTRGSTGGNRNRNVTPTPTSSHQSTSTPTPTKRPTSTPTPTPTKKAASKQYNNKRWHFWGFTGDSNIGPFIGTGLAAVAIGGSAYLVTRRRDLLKRWFAKAKNIIADIKLKIMAVKDSTKPQTDAFFVKAQAITKKINRVHRSKK